MSVILGLLTGAAVLALLMAGLWLAIVVAEVIVALWLSFGKIAMNANKPKLERISAGILWLLFLIPSFVIMLLLALLLKSFISDIKKMLNDL